MAWLIQYQYFTPNPMPNIHPTCIAYVCPELIKCISIFLVGSEYRKCHNTEKRTNKRTNKTNKRTNTEQIKNLILYKQVFNFFTSFLVFLLTVSQVS